MIRHRVRQFLEASTPPSAADLALAHQWLTEPLFDLFAVQHPRDVVHTARTARWLLDRGHRTPDLVVAAFLHDIGKGHQRRADRTAWVLAEAAGLGRVAASANSRFELRRAMARSRSHARIGAELAAAAGASEATIRLIRLHHRARPRDRVLALLQQADAAS